MLQVYEYYEHSCSRIKLHFKLISVLNIIYTLYYICENINIKFLIKFNIILYYLFYIPLYVLLHQNRAILYVLYKLYIL